MEQSYCNFYKKKGHNKAQGDSEKKDKILHGEGK